MLEDEKEISDSEIESIHNANNLMKSQSAPNFIDHMVHKIPLFSDQKDVTARGEVESVFEEASDVKSLNTISKSEN